MIAMFISVFRNMIDLAKKQISKETRREKLWISYDFYFDTFDFLDGRVRAYSLFGREIYWWLDITIETFECLLGRIWAAYENPGSWTNLVFQEGEFFIQNESGKVIVHVMFTGTFARMAGVDIKVDRKLIVETTEKLQLLKQGS